MPLNLKVHENDELDIVYYNGSSFVYHDQEVHETIQESDELDIVYYNGSNFVDHGQELSKESFNEFPLSEENEETQQEKDIFYDKEDITDCDDEKNYSFFFNNNADHDNNNADEFSTTSVSTSGSFFMENENETEDDLIFPFDRDFADSFFQSSLDKEALQLLVKAEKLSTKEKYQVITTPMINGDYSILQRVFQIFHSFSNEMEGRTVPIQDLNCQISPIYSLCSTQI